MPLVFTKEEIQEYLTEMGYPELEGEELDRFVKDLKRLIKFESKQRRRRRLGHTGHTHSDLSSIVTSESPSSTTLTSSTTPSSSMFGVQTSPESDTSVGEQHMKPFLRQPKAAPSSRTRSSNTDEYSTSVSGYNQPRSKVLASKQTRMSTLDEYTTSASEDINHNRIEGKKHSRPVTAPPSAEALRTVFDGRPKSSQVKVSSSSAVSSLESNTENLSEQELLNLMEYVLRNEVQNAKLEEDQEKKVCLPPPSIGRDPVALYHWYKAYWDRQKAPGEDRHMQLRWNVRAGTVGKVPCDPNGNPVEYLKRINPTSKPRSCWVAS